jgi:cbb3-type cytochrome oxidase subunit 3
MESKIADNIDNTMIAQTLGNSQIFLPNKDVQLDQPGVVQSVQKDLSQTIGITKNNFFNIFGYEISKMTIYFVIGLIVIGVLYYLYRRNKKSKSNKNKKSDDDTESDKESEKQLKNKDTDDEQSSKKNKNKSKEKSKKKDKNDSSD